MHTSNLNGTGFRGLPRRISELPNLWGPVENAGFLLGLERLHPPRRNQVDLKGGKGWGALLDVGNTPKRLFLFFVGGEVGVLLGGFVVVVVGFSYLPWGLGREVFFFLNHRCVTCAVFMWMVRWSKLLNDLNSQMKRHLLGESLSRQICHASKPSNFFTLSRKFQNWPISWKNSRDIRDSHKKKGLARNIPRIFRPVWWVFVNFPVFLEPSRL